MRIIDLTHPFTSHMPAYPGDPIPELKQISWISKQGCASYPELTEDFARGLIERGASIVGMDTPSPDRDPFKTHKVLLGAEILIIENLTNLEQLVDIQSFEVIALPMKVEADAGPVRVAARVA